MVDYNINAVARRQVFSGSAGIGPYAFTFEVLDQDDVAVYQNANKLTLTTDYTVTVNANGTGSVTLVVGAAASDNITIVGARDVERTTDFVTAGDLRASALNEQLDGQIIMVQQVDERVDRSIKLPVFDSFTGDNVLPSAATRADKILKFDSSGNVGVETASALVGGAVVGANFTNNAFTGDGSQTAFTTTVEAGSKNNAQVYIDGVYQLKSSFSISSTTLTFTEAPPLNSQIEVIIGNAIDTLDADSGNVNYNQGGTGAQTRTVENKLQDVVSVKDFGATGDGVTDDTAAFTSAEAATSSFIHVPAGTYVVSSLALDKTYCGAGVIKLDGTLQPQILSNARPNTVTVFPPVTNASNVLKPDGTWLDVSSSTTSGLQEAVNYACGDGTAGSGDHDLHIVGGEASTGGAVVYNLSTTLSFPAMQGKKISSGAVTLNFTSAIGTSPCVKFDSCMMVDVRLQGCQIVNGGTGTALLFEPTNSCPLDTDVHQIVDSSFHITTVVNTNNSAQANDAGAVVRFVPTSGTHASNNGIVNSTFIFDEINQENTASTTAGIWIQNSAANKPFANNYIKCQHVHNQTGVGVQIGTTSGHAATASGNTYQIVSNSNSGASSDFNVFEDEAVLKIANENANATYGLVLQSSAANCTIISSLLQGSTAAYNNLATNKTSNQWIGAKPIAASSAISVGASPFIHQNTLLRDQQVIVQAGTLTANTQISHDGSTYYDVGAANGIFNLPRGMYLKVTYSSAPSMRYYEV